MDLSLMRYRSGTLLSEYDDYFYEEDVTVYDCDGDGVTTPASWSPRSGSVNTSQRTEEMWDIVTPNYRKLSAQGKIFNNPMRKVESYEVVAPTSLNVGYEGEAYICSPVRWTRVFKKVRSGTAFMASDIPYLDISSSVDLDSMRSLAITQAWANIDHSEFLELVCLAELEKTVDGLVSLFKQVSHIANTVRKFNIRNLKASGKKLWKLREELSDVYMQARYGLRPLYYDTMGILKAVTTELDGSLNNRFTFRGHEGSNEMDSDSLEYHYYTSNYGLDSVTTVYRSSSIATTVRAGVLTELDILTANKLTGISQLAETAWELVPYSFVIDWFTNVGSLISSWAPNVGSKTLASWVSVEQIVNQNVTIGGTTVTTTDKVDQRIRNAGISVGGGSKSLTSKIYYREANPERPIYPEITVNLDPLKLLDLGLMARNLLKGSKLARRFRL